MTPPLTPDELLTTTRAVRRRLDRTRLVPLGLVRECLEIALQAPSGCLAARARGLGTAWTTLLLARVKEVAEVLHLDGW